MRAPLASGRQARSVRLTYRGLAMLFCGLALLVTGTLLGFTTVVIAGATLTLPVVNGWLVMHLSALERGIAAITLHRQVSPNPVSVGATVDVVATIAAAGPRGGSASRLHRLGLTAQAPEGLGLGQGIRAEITASFGAIQLAYTLTPKVRGEWPLGPVYGTTTDVFGVIRSRTAFTNDTTVRVWPALLPAFDGSSHAANGLHLSRSGLSAPSDEDTSLRPYQQGDDLRRVHWASAAKHNEMMVRSNEGASPSRATVLIDLVPLPEHQATQANSPLSARGQITEWAVQVAATLSLHLINTGHQTRLITTTDASASLSSGNRVQDPQAHGEILDRLVAVSVPLINTVTMSARTKTLEALSLESRTGETLVCVFTPPDPEHVSASLAAIKCLPSTGWDAMIALIALPEHSPRSVAHVELFEQLAESGWSTVPVPVGSNLGVVWEVAKRGNR